MSGKTTSLCYVYHRRNNIVELVRIADYLGGTFIPYVQRNIDWASRDLIKASANDISDGVGSIGCYDWSTHVRDFQNDCAIINTSNMPWVEVVQTNCTTLENLIEKIRQGWNPSYEYDGKHDIIFCINQKKNGCISALYTPRYMLELKARKWYFGSNTNVLVYGKIDERDIQSCASRYSLADNRKYLGSINRFIPETKIPYRIDNPKQILPINEPKTISDVRSSNEEKKDVDSIISGIIRTVIHDMPFSDTERELTLNVLESINNTGIQKKIMEKLDCPEEEAKQYLHEFLATRKYRLENDEAVGIMEKLIAIDSNYVASLREKVQTQWEQEQADKLRAAQQEVDDKKKELQEIQSRVNEEALKIEDIVRRQQEAEQAVQAAIHFREDVEKQIEDRLQKIRNNQPSMLVDTAFLHAVVQPGQTSGPASEAHELVMPPEDSPREVAISDTLSVILDACADLCGNHEECYEALAVFLLSSYMRNQPLLMIGEASVEAAELYAKAATGQGCVRLYPSDNMDVDVIAGQLDHGSCVCVVDGLERGYARTRELMRRMPDMRFVLTANHLEALYMEPESLYTSFIPVVTDLFFEGDRVIVWPEESCAKALNAMGAKLEKLPPSKALRTAQRSYFKDGLVSPMLRRRCLELQSCMTALSKEIGLIAPGVEDYSRLYLFSGMLKLLHRPEAFKRLIDDCKTLDEDTRATLRAFGGIEDE